MKIPTIIAMFAILSSIAIPLIMSINQANAEKTCAERGLAPECLPGQHVNTNGQTSNDIVGNPHYPQIGGDKTGNPHGNTICNPDKGNPHTDSSHC